MRESELEVKYFDDATRSIASIKGKDFTEELKKIKKAIEYILSEMQTIGTYELSEFTATAGVEASVWVLKANGSVSMKWTKPQFSKMKQSIK